MARIHIIDESWLTQPWFSTGGTREKKYLISPNGKYYYFKKSEYKPPKNGQPEKYYKYEFWSEVIAYRIGTALGFNVLKYEIGIEGETIGCICESMINSEVEELIEGLSYLQGRLPTFNPELNENRKAYTFQLIADTFDFFELKKFFPDFLNMLIFDALIGNSDRHQENWALICKYTPFTKLLHDVLNQAETIRDFHLLQRARLTQERTRVFSPLYDNGSSLGRELSAAKVNQMILDDSLIMDYITKGKSEIHWETRKITHFEMITNLLNSGYRDIVREIITNLIAGFSIEAIEAIIGNIDLKLPSSHSDFLIPDERKILIYKIITLRFEKLKELIQ